jgi:hypothetical protein
VNLTTHFTLGELTKSALALRQGIDNTPTATQIAALATLCETVLEPVRSLVGVPLRITSGFRCAALNAAVGGSKTSAHMDGRAADIETVGMGLIDAFDVIRHSSIPYDQIIQECGPEGWIHLGIAANGTTPRREMLTATGSPGAWTYTRVYV